MDSIDEKNLLILLFLINVVFVIKIWIMTIDVNKIKKLLYDKQDKNKLNLLFLKGEKKELKELLTENFFVELLKLKEDIKNNTSKSDHSKIFNEKYSIIKNKYTTLFNKYGIDQLNYDSYTIEEIPI